MHFQLYSVKTMFQSIPLYVLVHDRKTDFPCVLHWKFKINIHVQIGGMRYILTALPIITSYSTMPIFCSPQYAHCMFPRQISPRCIDRCFLLSLARQSLICSHRRCYNLHILICLSCGMNIEGRVSNVSPIDLLSSNV